MEWAAPGYDPGKVRSFHCSILVSDTVCCLGVLDLNSGELLSLLSKRSSGNTEQTLAYLAQHKLNPSRSALVTAISLPDQCAMVPEMLASDREGSAHLKLLHGELLDGSLRDRHLDESAARLYFRNGRDHERSVLHYWPTSMLYPMQMAVLRSAMARTHIKGRTALLHILSDRLDFVIVDQSGPILLNSFVVRAPEDTLYYSLFAIEQTSSDKENLHLYFSGPDCDSGTIDLLKEYFPFVRPAIEKGSSQVDGTAFLSVIERDLCVS